MALWGRAATVGADEHESEAMSPERRRPALNDSDALVAQLDMEELRDIVRDAADRYEDVARAVRLAVSRAAGGLTQLRAEIDGSLRTGRFLGYRESTRWATHASPVVKRNPGSGGVVTVG